MSISTSEPILLVENLNLAFVADVHRAWSWRDAFTAALNRPFRGSERSTHRVDIARNISFKVHNGERVGILGLNGTGKTSLCRCVAGIYRPNSGTIAVNGQMRAIFDTSIGIQPELTGRENAELLVHFMYPDLRGKKELVEEAIEFSELGRFADVPYRSYSKGMQARLFLSIISRRTCDLFILDEVFDGADQFFQEKISDQMLKILTRSGAVLFVSHSLDQIRKVCNRLMVLDQGRIVYDGEVNAGIRHYEKIR